MDYLNRLAEKIKQLRLFSDQPGRLSVGSTKELARVLIEMAARLSLLEDKLAQLEGLVEGRDHLLRDDLSDLFFEMGREVNSFRSLWRAKLDGQNFKRSPKSKGVSVTGDE